MYVIERLKQIADEFPSGFTVYTITLEPVKKGWIVAMKETQNCFGDEGLRRALEIVIGTTEVIGGWKKKELFYWDAVMLFDNETEATKAGIANEQLAIYNIETNYLKFL